MSENILPYWMAFAHARKFSNRRKMEFLIEVVHNQTTLDVALESVRKGDRLGFWFTDMEWNGLKKEVEELPNYAFLAEKLSSQGIRCINVMDQDNYPRTLKKNLKRDAPILIYTKGNSTLLKQKSVAIVGARKAGDISLEFTDQVAKKAISNGALVVSGFAKGVDKKALDSALKYNGRSIVVLPQGIETYRSKAYYKYIVKGDVLVISTYHPNAPWSVGLAMDRNKTIYGLAGLIYAAESNSKGGTWEGVLDGIRRGRTVYIRKPGPREKNANDKLIQAGAIPVDIKGNPVTLGDKYNVEGSLRTSFLKEPSRPLVAEEPQLEYEKERPQKGEQESENSSLNELNDPAKIILSARDILRKEKGKGLTTAEIASSLPLSDKVKKRLASILNKSDLFLKRKKGRSNIYTLKESQPQQQELF